MSESSKRHSKFVSLIFILKQLNSMEMVMYFMYFNTIK